jgi:hypothetical protein
MPIGSRGKQRRVSVDDEDILIAVEIEVAALCSEGNLIGADGRDAGAAAVVLVTRLADDVVQGEVLGLKIGDPQIGFAVAIEIADVRAHAAVHPPAGTGRAPVQFRHFGQFSRSFIEVQKIGRRIVGDVGVKVSVGIQIGEDHPQPFPVFAKAGLTGTVTKRTITLIDEERVGLP